MKKIILINPKLGYNIEEDYTQSIPMGPLCLGSYLQEKGYKVRLIDNFTEPNPDETFLKELEDTDYLGFSLMTPQIGDAIRLSKKARELKPEIPILWGGVHSTLLPKETVTEQYVDYAVVGEGEQSTYELLKCLENNEDPSKVKGTAFYKNNKFIFTGKRDNIDMNTLPTVDYSLLQKRAREIVKVIFVHTSRGCNHRCAFCIAVATCDKWRGMSVKRSLDEIEHALKFFPHTNHIKFREPNFFMDKNRAIGIINGILERNIDIRWEPSIRASYLNNAYINDELLEKMKRSGCFRLWFGAESGSDEILKLIKKDLTVDMIINSAKQVKKFGFEARYTFMTAIPGETEKDLKMTADLIDKILKIDPRIDIIGPLPYRPYPGSPLYEECKKLGWEEPKTNGEWEKIMDRGSYLLNPKYLPWVKDPYLAQTFNIFRFFGAMPWKKMLSRTRNLKVNTNILFKFGFILLMRLRWKTKFFKFPLDVMIANKVSKQKLVS